MFFNIGAGEMLLIAIVLLVAVGPEQLPTVIRKIGRTMGQLKSMSDRLRDDFMTGMNQIEDATDVKSWADKLDTPWAGPVDNTSWAKNIDPPFTAKRADPDKSDDGDESTGSQDRAADEPEPGNDRAAEGGAEPLRRDEQAPEVVDPVRPGALAPLGDEPATSNGHSEPNRSENGTDETPDPVSEDRE